jgi:branched-chain amino acid transport system ATP-binding protein
MSSSVLNVLTLAGVRVSILGAEILRDISFAIPRGGLVALVGRNGAGKTTTLRAVMGLLSVSRGRISIEDIDLERVPAFQRARLGIGYVPEDRRLIGQLSVKDNLLLPAWTHKGTRASERLGFVYRLMPELEALGERKAAQLSGGQQKMAALARALMSATKLLLLDEPFEGLSPGMGEKVAATIREVQRSGVAVLLAESDLKRVEFVEHVYTIERGEMVADQRTV